MLKCFALFENVRQNVLTLAEKKFVFFFPKISTQRKKLDTSDLCSNVG